jgi:hypothetical protein
MTVLADALEAALRTVNDAEPPTSPYAPRAQAAAFTPAGGKAAAASKARAPAGAPADAPTVGDGTVNTAMKMLRVMDGATMKATECPFIATPKGCMKAATCPFKH